MRRPNSVAALTEFGRVRLSKSFFMRDFLFSDIAAIHGFPNVPDDPDLAVAAGRRLCEELLEPIQDRFGRIAIRSAFRSAKVNGFGNAQQKAGKAGYNCANNAANLAGHIWDKRDEAGNMGATACIVVPSVWDRFQAEGDWRKLAWWIHDHLPYSDMEFFPRYWAFNIQWREQPVRRIYSFAKPRGILTRPGMPNFAGSHEAEWRALFD
ncbi:hypothetical protein [Aureimonas leprariae]|uniref:Peptidase M15 n=1 Tax=Plantimonas leprariae TaxID=2615207 RepID=A0A7V7TXY9_9HYPH|nr:hypothetical protein [Aureimonas leprariae]KAB0681741.1 hypothetical protein F6X38_02635 [Aureimonas leprariae]